MRTINHMLTTAGNIYLVGTDPWAAPRIGRILRACGHTETAGTDDYLYKPTSVRSQLPFLTLRHDDGDYRYLVKDARGRLTEFRFNMGEVPSAGFELMALAGSKRPMTPMVELSRNRTELVIAPAALPCRTPLMIELGRLALSEKLTTGIVIASGSWLATWPAGSRTARSSPSRR